MPSVEWGYRSSYWGLKENVKLVLGSLRRTNQCRSGGRRSTLHIIWKRRRGQNVTMALTQWAKWCGGAEQLPIGEGGTQASRGLLDPALEHLLSMLRDGDRALVPEVSPGTAVAN